MEKEPRTLNNDREVLKIMEDTSGYEQSWSLSGA